MKREGLCAIILSINLFFANPNCGIFGSFWVLGPEAQNRLGALWCGISAGLVCVVQRRLRGRSAAATVGICALTGIAVMFITEVIARQMGDYEGHYFYWLSRVGAGILALLVGDVYARRQRMCLKLTRAIVIQLFVFLAMYLVVVYIESRYMSVGLQKFIAYATGNGEEDRVYDTLCYIACTMRVWMWYLVYLGIASATAGESE